MRLVHYSRDPAFRPDGRVVPVRGAGCHFYLEGCEDPWPGRCRTVWEAPEGAGRVAAEYVAGEGQRVVEVFVPAGQLPLLRLVGREPVPRLPWELVFAAWREREEGKGGDGL